MTWVVFVGGLKHMKLRNIEVLRDVCIEIEPSSQRPRRYDLREFFLRGNPFYAYVDHEMDLEDATRYIAEYYSLQHFEVSQDMRQGEPAPKQLTETEEELLEDLPEDVRGVFRKYLEDND